jgi:hypothetical protein
MLAAVTAGLFIALLSALTAEFWWQILRPTNYPVANICWMLGIFSRVIVVLAGLAFFIKLRDLSPPPLLAATGVGYVIVLVFEVRLTIRRMNRLRR